MKSQKGQAAVEFALVLPILLLLVCGVIDFGRILYTANALTTVCEQGARYASIYTTKTVDEVETYVKDNTASGIDKTPIHVTVNPPPRVSGGTVTVTISYTMSYITPFISNLFSSSSKTMNFDSTCRVE